MTKLRNILIIAIMLVIVMPTVALATNTVECESGYKYNQETENCELLGNNNFLVVRPRMTNSNYHVTVQDNNLVRVNFMTNQFMKGGVIVKKSGVEVRFDSEYIRTYHTVYFYATPGDYEIIPVAEYGPFNKEFYGQSKFITIQ